MRHLPWFGTAIAALMTACTTAATRDHALSAITNEPTNDIATAPDPDRRAILAMAGEFRVRFDFRETVVLSDAYERAEPQRSGAYELVLVLADEPQRVVLQHLLVSREGGHVTKHWRQDWHWQASQRLEFSDEQTWRLRDIPADRRLGTWTQCVYEVSDAPRYCGTGHWNHRYGVATWTSDRSWRPLPRREYSKRDDYNVLNAQNRHTIVPGGWTHEQDNTKTIRSADGGSRTLVRESGFNDYVRLQPGEFDFSPAHRYWQQTHAYWARVRAEWDARIAADAGVHLAMPVDGMPLIRGTFEQADRTAEGGEVSLAELDELFDRYVHPPSPTTRELAAH